MKLKKRSGRSRIRGTRTCGWAMKKHKGSGNRGGKGMSGTGKRGDQRKTQLIGKLYPYFGRRGITSKSTVHRISNVMNLREIADKFKDKEIKLEKYKILGEGEGFKATIYAESASKSAIEKMEKAGGKIVIKVMEKKEIPQKKVEDKK
jgi:large subunit ribosomal protein L15